MELALEDEQEEVESYGDDIDDCHGHMEDIGEFVRELEAGTVNTVSDVAVALAERTEERQKLFKVLSDACTSHEQQFQQPLIQSDALSRERCVLVKTPLAIRFLFRRNGAFDLVRSEEFHVFLHCSASSDAQSKAAAPTLSVQRHSRKRKSEPRSLSARLKELVAEEGDLEQEKAALEEENEALPGQVQALQQQVGVDTLVDRVKRRLWCDGNMELLRRALLPETPKRRSKRRRTLVLIDAEAPGAEDTTEALRKLRKLDLRAPQSPRKAGSARSSVTSDTEGELDTDEDMKADTPSTHKMETRHARKKKKTCVGC